MGLSLAWARKRLLCPDCWLRMCLLDSLPAPLCPSPFGNWFRVPLIHPGIYQGFIQHPLSTRHGAQNWCEGRRAWHCQQRTFILRGRQTTNKDVKELRKTQTRERGRQRWPCLQTGRHGDSVRRGADTHVGRDVNC